MLPIQPLMQERNVQLAPQKSSRTWWPVRAATALFMALTVIIGLSATPASAATPLSACNGQTNYFKVRWYSPRVPYRAVPLRCGSATGFGLRHIASRWNPWFEDMIQVTVASPTRTALQGNATVFYLEIRNCPDPYVFRVVVEFTNTTDGNPKGIITAVQDFAAI